MNKFNYVISLEPAVAENLFNVLKQMQCISPDTLVCDYCYNDSGCKVFRDLAHWLRLYLDYLDESKRIEQHQKEEEDERDNE